MESNTDNNNNKDGGNRVVYPKKFEPIKYEVHGKGSEWDCGLKLIIGAGAGLCFGIFLGGGFSFIRAYRYLFIIIVFIINIFNCIKLFLQICL